MEQTDPTLKGPFAIIHRGGGVPIVFLFPLAPQRVEVDFPARGAIHQTLDDNFLDDFSGVRAVLARVTLRGTFGYSSRWGGIGLPLPGSMHLLAFEKIFETFNALSRQLKQRLHARQEFLALSRLYFWRVWIDRLRYSIQSRDPLLYYYDLSFYRLQDYLSPVTLATEGAAALPQSTGSALGGLF